MHEIHLALHQHSIEHSSILDQNTATMKIETSKETSFDTVPIRLLETIHSLGFDYVCASGIAVCCLIKIISRFYEYSYAG